MTTLALKLGCTVRLETADLLRDFPKAQKYSRRLGRVVDFPSVDSPHFLVRLLNESTTALIGVKLRLPRTAFEIVECVGRPKRRKNMAQMINRVVIVAEGKFEGLPGRITDADHGFFIIDITGLDRPVGLRHYQFTPIEVDAGKSEAAWSLVELAKGGLSSSTSAKSDAAVDFPPAPSSCLPTGQAL